MADKQEILKKTSIGGQALIEGVMMRGPEKTAMEESGQSPTGVHPLALCAGAV